MRWVICAGLLLALTPRAWAGDFDVLRGAQPTYHWGGFYGGGQFSESSAVANFNQTAAPEIAYILRNTAIEADEDISGWSVINGRNTASGQGYGGFVGYNVEWEDVIVGLEVNYNRVSLTSSASDGLTRSFVDSNALPANHNYDYNVSVSGQAALKITDIATFRARAGWEAGCFLPYAFGGFALGRGNVSTSGTVGYTAIDYPNVETPPVTPLPDLNFGPYTQTTTQNGAFLYGVAAGVGADIALTQHIFVRGEAEYVYFAPLDHVQASITSVRVGAGLKF